MGWFLLAKKKLNSKLCSTRLPETGVISWRHLRKNQVEQYSW